jgi:hypothetical protein
MLSLHFRVSFKSLTRTNISQTYTLAIKISFLGGMRLLAIITSPLNAKMR